MVPIREPTRLRVESSLESCPAMAEMPTVSSSTSKNTTVEWPRENQNPTDSGRRSSFLRSVSSLRVVLSMAAM